jgi:hypothetical protein
VQAFGVLALVGGYCAWYTLYQRTWGDGSGFLFNLTGSSRFKGTGQRTVQQGPGNSPATTPTFPGSVSIGGKRQPGRVEHGG